MVRFGNDLKDHLVYFYLMLFGFSEKVYVNWKRILKGKLITHSFVMCQSHQEDGFLDLY